MIVIHPLIKALVLIMFLINVVSIVMFLECTLVGTVTVTDFTCDPPPPPPPPPPFWFLWIHILYQTVIVTLYMIPTDICDTKL